MSNILKKSDIVRWASEKLTARSDLPALIRRLIHATADRIERIDFPAFESVSRSGFDGELHCPVGNAWLPSGRSMWELSVNKKVGGKANDDYENSKKKADVASRQDSTLVILTAEHWEKKATWREEVENLGEWKSVRTYDADDLEQWLEQAPAVAVWFAELLGLPVGEFTDFHTKWDSIHSSTTPSLTPDVFLASRERSQQMLNEWLSSKASYLAMVSPFPEDVIDFVTAAIESLKDSEKERVGSSLVFVETLRAFREVCKGEHIRTIIVDPQVQITQADIAKAIECETRVLHAQPPFDPLLESTVLLERARGHEIARALEKCGLSTVSAEQKAHDCGGITSLLKTSLASFPIAPDAPVISENERSTLRTCLILGGWDGSNSDDRKVVEHMTGKSYDEFEVDCVKWSRQRNPLLLTADGKWRLISKGDAWRRMSSLLPSSAFDSVHPQVVNVLQDFDPAYNLADKDRWLAKVKGFAPTYSSAIKKHIAETLAFLGAFGEGLFKTSSGSEAGYAIRVVKDVLSTVTSWQQWASLGHLLPKFAEAAPEHYLEAVEAFLRSDRPNLAGLFRPREEHPLVSGCDYTNLLWSLETVAWSPAYYPRVCRILLKLHRFHSPSNYANSPKSSLRRLLSCARPYTTADVDDRIELIRRLVKEDDDGGWMILTELLSELHYGSLSMMTSRPDWRGWASDWQSGVTHSEFIKQLDTVASMVTENVGSNLSRWLDLVDILTVLPREYINEVISALQNLNCEDFDDEQRKKLCNKISEFISLHRPNVDSSTRLTSKDLDNLSDSVSALQPVSLAIRHAWLFEQWVERHFRRELDDVKDAANALKADRMNAMKEILIKNGLPGAIELAWQAAHPYTVGAILAELTNEEYTTDLIPKQVSKEIWSVNFVFGFVNYHCRETGDDWIIHLLERCEDADQKAWLLTMIPFTCSSWDLVEQQGEQVKQLYWNRVMHNGLDRDVESICRCSTELIAHGRLADAVDIVCVAIHSDISLPIDVLLAPLEGILCAESEYATEQIKRISEYEVGQILTDAQSREDASEDRLFRLEFNFLKMLGRHNHGTPRTLFRRLSTDPEFFVEALSLTFKSKNDSEDSQDELSDEELERRRALASSAYDLISKWNLIPGADESGVVDVNVLREWVNHSRKIAEQQGYLEVCDHQIGQVFSNAPSESDESWPCEAVRTVCEEIRTERLASGINIGLKNSRGVVCRGEGGDQERELAEKYRKLAAQILIDSPFVSSVLGDIAKSYLADAKKWDESDEWER